ncbi:MAG: recombinase family protein [Rhodobacteraceae bacterium]|nr:recombinase family protein [Paracoccaceae bacterium]
MQTTVCETGRVPPDGVFPGCARVLTQGQDSAEQWFRVEGAGILRILDDVITGSITHRPDLNSLPGSARACDMIAVIRLDRPKCSRCDDSTALAEPEERRINLLNSEKEIYGDSAVGKVIFRTSGAIAQFESYLRGERAKGRMWAIHKRGYRSGHCPVPPDTVGLPRKPVGVRLSASQPARHPGVGQSTASRVLRAETRNEERT